MPSNKDVFSIYKNSDFSASFIEFPQDISLFKHQNSYRNSLNLRTTGSLQKNISLLKIIAENYKEKNKTPEETQTLLEIGHLLRSDSNFKKAADVYLEALSLALKIKNYEFAVIALLRLSDCCRIQGLYTEALNYCEQAKEKINQIPEHSKLLLADCQETTGDVYRSSGSWEKARLHYEKAREIYDLIDDGLVGMLNTFNSSGSVCLSQNNIEEAEDFYRAALEVSDAIQDKQGILNAKFGLAQVAMKKEDYSLAFQVADYLLENYNYIGDKLGYANALFLKAQVLNAFSHTSKAIEYFQFSKAIFDKIHCELNSLLADIQIAEIKNISNKSGILQRMCENRFKTLMNKHIPSEEIESWPLERKGSIFLTTDLKEG